MTFWEWLGRGYEFGFVRELQRLLRATRVNVLFYGDVREAFIQGDCGLSGSSTGEGTGPEMRADQAGHPAGLILHSQ